VTPDDLSAICTTVERGIREFSLLGAPEKPVLPLPIDCAAEAEIGVALVSGCVSNSELPGLQPRYFTHPLHAAIVEVSASCPRESDGTLSLVFLENELRNRGHRGPLDVWLLTLRDAVPFKGADSCLAAVGRIRELWRRRRLIERLQRIIVQLKTDGTTTDTAIAELKTFTTQGPTKVKAA
jgi:hypothetical protein